jgi:hypothetical protein
MAKRKSIKGQTMIYKTLHRKLKIKQHEPPLKTGDELMCSWHVEADQFHSDYLLFHIIGLFNTVTHVGQDTAYFSEHMSSSPVLRGGSCCLNKGYM